MDKNKKLFPQRLWELIHDEKYNFCLRWSPDGQRVYLNRNEFETHYLKTPNNQFHTQKAISFVRQMNMYGFRKVDDCYYENDNFKRDCQHLLKNMVRRHSSKCFLATSTGDMTGIGQHPMQATLAEHQLQHQHQQLPSPVARGAGRMNSPPNNNHHQRHQHQHHHHHHHQQQAQTGRANNFGDSIGNLGAALAAISSNNQNVFRGPQQASSLYHRLAALNFGGQTNRTQVVNQQQQQQQQRTAATVMMVPCNNNNQQQPAIQQHQQQNHNQQNQQQDYIERSRLLLDQTSRNGDHYNGLDIPMSVQESMSIRQALQHDLFRSFLQLNKQQPATPFLSQQQSQPQQQLSPNLLLESLANLTRANLVAQAARSSNGVTAATPLAPLGSLLLDQTLLGPLMNRTTAFDPISVGDDEDEAIDDDDDEGDIYPIDYEDDLPNGGTGSSSGGGGGGGGGTQYSSSSTSSTNNEPVVRYQQEQFVEDTVLDLAKPSITRSNDSRNISPRG